MADGNDDGKPPAWDGAGGAGWASLQDVMHRMLQPLQDVLVDTLDGSERRVLDVGCGAGSTTVAIARRLGPTGTATGIDIAEPLVAAARSRAEREGVPAEFVLADAQRYDFSKLAGFDTIVSRFGVMFFDDFVAAFTNLRSAATDGGTLRVITWRHPSENPFMTTAEDAAAGLVAFTEPPPDAPGQFGLASEAHVRTILDQSGWSEIGLEPVDRTCTLPEADLIPYLTTLGPLGRAMSELDPQARSRILDVVRPAFDRYVSGDQVRFTAACWMITARA